MIILNLLENQAFSYLKIHVLFKAVVVVVIIAGKVQSCNDSERQLQTVINVAVVTSQLKLSFICSLLMLMCGKLDQKANGIHHYHRHYYRRHH